MNRTLHLALALILVVPAIAGAQNREHLQLMADLRILQEQVTRIQLAVNQLTERVEANNSRIDQVTAASTRGFADQKLVIDQIQNTLGTMREKLDDNTTRVSQLTQEFGAVREGLRRLTEQINALILILRPPPEPGEEDPQADSGDASGPDAGAGPAPIETVTMPASPTVYLQAAMDNYYSGQYDLAIEAFTEFVEMFPEATQAATAQFHLAESYYQQRRCAQALPAYQRVTSAYPDSPHVRDAFLMQGICYRDLDQEENARSMFLQVISDFPGSTQAIQAEQLLEGN